MKNRFFQYNKAITYVGELDQNSLGYKVKSVLETLPIYLIQLEARLPIIEVDNNNVLLLHITCYLCRGIISEDESNEIFKQLRTDLDTSIEEEFLEQKLIFSIE